jgi:hypothetical protein
MEQEVQQASGIPQKSSDFGNLDGPYGTEV